MEKQNHSLESIVNQLKQANSNYVVEINEQTPQKPMSQHHAPNSDLVYQERLQSMVHHPNVHSGNRLLQSQAGIQPKTPT